MIKSIVLFVTLIVTVVYSEQFLLLKYPCDGTSSKIVSYRPDTCYQSTLNTKFNSFIFHSNSSISSYTKSLFTSPNCTGSPYFTSTTESGECDGTFRYSNVTNRVDPSLNLIYYELGGCENLNNEARYLVTPAICLPTEDSSEYQITSDVTGNIEFVTSNNSDCSITNQLSTLVGCLPPATRKVAFLVKQSSIVMDKVVIGFNSINVSYHIQGWQNANVTVSVQLEDITTPLDIGVSSTSVGHIYYSTKLPSLATSNAIFSTTGYNLNGNQLTNTSQPFNITLMLNVNILSSTSTSISYLLETSGGGEGPVLYATNFTSNGVTWNHTTTNSSSIKYTQLIPSSEVTLLAKATKVNNGWISNDVRVDSILVSATLPSSVEIDSAQLTATTASLSYHAVGGNQSSDDPIIYTVLVNNTKVYQGTSNSTIVRGLTGLTNYRFDVQAGYGGPNVSTSWSGKTYLKLNNISVTIDTTVTSVYFNVHVVGDGGSPYAEYDVLIDGFYQCYHYNLSVDCPLVKQSQPTTFNIEVRAADDNGDTILDRFITASVGARPTNDGEISLASSINLLSLTSFCISLISSILILL